MKDNVLDLLIYLFENYMSADDEPRPDRNTLKLELDKAGFAEPDIERALEWLDGLSGEQLGKVAEATARGFQDAFGRDCAFGCSRRAVFRNARITSRGRTARARDRCT